MATLAAAIGIPAAVALYGAMKVEEARAAQFGPVADPTVQKALDAEKQKRIAAEAREAKLLADLAAEQGKRSKLERRSALSMAAEDAFRRASPDVLATAATGVIGVWGVTNPRVVDALQAPAKNYIRRGTLWELYGVTRQAESVPQAGGAEKRKAEEADGEAKRAKLEEAPAEEAGDVDNGSPTPSTTASNVGSVTTTPASTPALGPTPAPENPPPAVASMAPAPAVSSPPPPDVTPSSNPFDAPASASGDEESAYVPGTVAPPPQPAAASSPAPAPAGSSLAPPASSIPPPDFPEDDGSSATPSSSPAASDIPPPDEFTPIPEEAPTQSGMPAISTFLPSLGGPSTPPTPIRDMGYEAFAGEWLTQINAAKGTVIKGKEDTQEQEKLTRSNEEATRLAKALEESLTKARSRVYADRPKIDKMYASLPADRQAEVDPMNDTLSEAINRTNRLIEAAKVVQTAEQWQAMDPGWRWAKQDLETAFTNFSNEVTKRVPLSERLFGKKAAPAAPGAGDPQTSIHRDILDGSARAIQDLDQQIAATKKTWDDAKAAREALCSMWGGKVSDYKGGPEEYEKVTQLLSRGEDALDTLTTLRKEWVDFLEEYKREAGPFAYNDWFTPGEEGRKTSYKVFVDLRAAFTALGERTAAANDHLATVQAELKDTTEKLQAIRKKGRMSGIVRQVEERRLQSIAEERSIKNLPNLQLDCYPYRRKRELTAADAVAAAPFFTGVSDTSTPGAPAVVAAPAPAPAPAVVAPPPSPAPAPAPPSPEAIAQARQERLQRNAAATTAAAATAAAAEVLAEDDAVFAEAANDPRWKPADLKGIRDVVVGNKIMTVFTRIIDDYAHRREGRGSLSDLLGALGDLSGKLKDPESGEVIQSMLDQVKNAIDTKQREDARWEEKEEKATAAAVAEAADPNVQRISSDVYAKLTPEQRVGWEWEHGERPWDPAEYVRKPVATAEPPGPPTSLAFSRGAAPALGNWTQAGELFEKEAEEALATRIAELANMYPSPDKPAVKSKIEEILGRYPRSEWDKTLDGLEAKRREVFRGQIPSATPTEVAAVLAEIQKLGPGPTGDGEGEVTQAPSTDAELAAVLAEIDGSLAGTVNRPLGEDVDVEAELAALGNTDRVAALDKKLEAELAPSTAAAPAPVSASPPANPDAWKTFVLPSAVPAAAESAAAEPSGQSNVAPPPLPSPPPKPRNIIGAVPSSREQTLPAATPFEFGKDTATTTNPFFAHKKPLAEEGRRTKRNALWAAQAASSPLSKEEEKEIAELKRALKGTENMNNVQADRLGLPAKAERLRFLEGKLPPKPRWTLGGMRKRTLKKPRELNKRNVRRTRRRKNRANRTHKNSR